MKSNYCSLSKRYRYLSPIFFHAQIKNNFVWEDADGILHDESTSVLKYRLKIYNNVFSNNEQVDQMYISKYTDGHYLLFEDYIQGPGITILSASNSIDYLKYLAYEILTKRIF